MIQQADNRGGDSNNTKEVKSIVVVVDFVRNGKKRRSKV